MKEYQLANGMRVPQVGFGTYKAIDGDDQHVIAAAIEQGYRYFDTASFYDNEAVVGAAIRESGLPREEFQIASKLWRDEMGYEGAKAAFRRSLERLGTDYLDVYLIHWPRPDMESDWKTLDRETWRALEELYTSGQVRAVGVSNFLPHHLENLMDAARIMPMVDQVEFHPGYPELDVLSFCHAHGILVQAWSPMGRTRVLQDPLLCGMAAKYNVTTAQLCIRYALEKGVQPMPKSSNTERMQQNRNVFGFALSGEDIKALDNMPQTGWSGQHPDNV